MRQQKKPETKKVPDAKQPEPAQEPPVEEVKKEEVKKEEPKVVEQREDYLKLTNDFKSVMRGQLESLTLAKTQRDMQRTKAEAEAKKREKAERQLQTQKFAKFKKKPPFLKATHKIGCFRPEKEAVVIHDAYKKQRQRDAAVTLDRAYETNTWKPGPRRMDYFQPLPLEKMSEKAKAQFEANEKHRLELLALEQQRQQQLVEGTLKKTQAEAKLAATKVWYPNISRKEILQDVNPLNDGTYTPRHRHKAISLERNYEKKVWHPTKKHMDLLANQNREKKYKS